jgi:hypothetical protein
MRPFFIPVSLLICAAAHAQTPANTTSATATPDKAPAAAGPIKLGPVTFTGSIRARYYSWDWFEPAVGQNQYQYTGDVMRLNFAQKLESWDWDVELGLPFMLGLPTGASLAAPQGALGLGANYYTANGGNNRFPAMIYPKQAFVRLDKLGGDPRQTLRIGRFLFNDGGETTPKNPSLATIKTTRIAQRLLGEFGFSESGRSFDGLHYSFTTPANNITIVGAVPLRGVFQVDGWGWNKVGFGYGAYTREWGHGKHTADTRFFMLEYEDWRGVVLKTDNRPAALRRADTDNIRIDTYGGHSLHAIATDAGAIDLMAWGAVQTGHWGTEKHRAYAFAFEGGFQPKILPKLKPWLRAGFREGSGDSNPNDNTHNTFFEVLDAPRSFARTPFFNTMNTQDLMGHMILRPHPKVTVTSEFHSLRLATVNDFWYSGGGVFQPWSFGYTGRSTSGRRSLANFYDTNFEYRANRKVTATAYIGYMQGLAAIEVIYPKNKDGRFGCLELLYRF